MREESSEDELFDSEEEERITKKAATSQAAQQETSSAEAAPLTNELIVEKVLGRKVLSVEGQTEELFYIKWKGMAFIHASWERREDIERVDANGKLKLKRFMLSAQQPGILGEKVVGAGGSSGEEEEALEEEEVEYFSADFVEVQRVISCNDASCAHAHAKRPSDLLRASGKKRKADEDSDDTEDADCLYLVKWRGLSYEECTWERWQDIKSFYREVWLFWQLQKPPTLPIHHLPFPALQDYKKLEESPVFGVSHVVPTEDEEEPNEGLRLRDYQLEGVNWLLWNWWHRRSCILADEMGLGKTIQTISFLHQLRYNKCTKINGPFLIIAPLSLVEQWYSEISTWSPDMNCILLHGSHQAREKIFAHEFYFQEPFVSKAEAKNLKAAHAHKFHILLTTFEVAVKEISKLSRVHWKLLVIDEAHKLKNAQSRNFITLGLIPRDHCLLLTGTPLQNKTEELWALLNFADPNKFNSLEDFIGKFGDLKNVKQVARLHEMLKPYLLRRIKEDVERSLPPKEETIVEVALTSIQKRFYRAIFEKNTAYLYKGLKASNQPSLMNVMMELRKCCNHPYLVRGVEERVLSEITEEEKRDEAIIMKKMIESSGKLVLLDKLLPRLQSQGHKVLIFSQMVRVLNLLEDFLRYRGYTFERLDGGSRSCDRKEAVDRFCKLSANKFIMLLSTKAGGLGLNLTAADTVIIFDSDWNPQNDLQAQARAHRIGQTKAVMVYRLLTRKTYEMEMFHQASMKLGLDRAVLAHARIEQGEDGTHASAADVKMSLKEIDALLKRGAYDVFREDDSEQKEFEEADIDAILQRRAHKVVYNEGKNPLGTLSNFSKASFVSADEKEDVDINDPDFWRKAVGLKDEAGGDLMEEEENVVLSTQRTRKQTTVYGVNIDEDEEMRKLLKGSSRPTKQEKEEKLAQKAAQKEAQLKEKAERDEARKLKLLEEARLKSDPRSWGSHGRDRVLRALNMYGFGRWEKIKKETGKELMEIKDLDTFCRAYIYQCGLCAGDAQPLKGDSPFTLEVIRSSRELEALVQAGERTIFVPPSLQEPRFTTKLKTGLARKTLNKLDTLAKLNDLIHDVVLAFCAKQGLEGDAVPTELHQVDSFLAQCSAADIAEMMPFKDVRPKWARSCSWWDLDCDRQLILGVFKHGYGQYDDVKDDLSLCFRAKLDEHLAALNLKCSGVKDAVAAAVSAATAGVAMSPGPAPGTISVKKEKVIAPDMDMGEDDAEAEDDALAMEDVDDNDNDAGDVGANANNPATSTSQPGYLPDPRHLNRIVVWLLTSEIARMSKAEFREIEGQKNNAVVGGSGRRGGASGDATMDSSHSADLLSFVCSKEEQSLFKALKSHFDNEAMALAMRPHIQGLRKCEAMLVQARQAKREKLKKKESHSSRNEMQSSTASLSSSVNTEKETSDSMDVATEPESNEHVVKSSAESKESEEGEQLEMMDVEEEPEHERERGGDMVITEDDAKTLPAWFILHGAPLAENEFSRVYPMAREIFGLESPSSSQTAYNWSAVRRRGGFELKDQSMVLFYERFWMPFCLDILTSKNLTISPQKALVPNPLLSAADHHVASRGLCQVFALHQQALHTINFVLKHHFQTLVDYLRDTKGRAVDNMPIWWCPWIHDLGLLLGFLKHGYLSMDEIYADTGLPFHASYLQSFVRKVFVQGTEKMPGAAQFDLLSDRERELFVLVTASARPDPRELEVRVVRILEDMTLSLPVEHPCKIALSSWSLRVQLLPHSADGSETVVKPSRSEKAQQRNSMRVALPAMSVKAFAETTRKRRKIHLVTSHPECA